MQNSSEKKSKSAEIKMQQEGFKFFLKKCDIQHTFNDAEIEILVREKNDIRKRAQEIKEDLEDSNPNIDKIHEYKI